LKKNSRLLALLLILTLLLTALPISVLAVDGSGGDMSNIVYTTGYTVGQFTDVDESKWYGEAGQQVIGSACRLGLMKGIDGGFSPNGTVSLAEAVAMAVRLHNLYCGSTAAFEQGTPWYKVYIDYAIEKGIIFFDDFEDLTVEKTIKGAGTYVDYTRAATRAEMAYIFANALPDKELAAINTVETIPDVDGSTAHANSIFLLYRAGVLTGDQTGAFSPDASIDRAAAAAILTRVALPAMRKTVTAETSKAVPLWGEVYASRMSVSTAEKLRTIYTTAVLNRIDSFEIKTTKAVLDEFYNGGVIFDFNVHKIQYEYGGYEPSLLRITITYTLFGEVEALGLTADAASRASDEALDYNAEIETIKHSIIGDGMTDREKCKAIHDYMTTQYDYDQTFMEDSYSFHGLLDNGVAVCQAYMQLFYLLANRAGVYCEMITGLADGSGTGNYVAHGWNIVYLDDTWYHIDVTFDDPVGGGGKIYYDYFLIESEEIDADHSW